jgi:hypothetical protein
VPRALPRLVSFLLEFDYIRAIAYSLIPPDYKDIGDFAHFHSDFLDCSPSATVVSVLPAATAPLITPVCSVDQVAPVT